MAKKKRRRQYPPRPEPETPPQVKRFAMVLSALALASIAGLILLGTEHLHVFWYPESYIDTLYVLLYAICLLMICLWTLYVTNEFLEKRKGRKWETQISVKLTKVIDKCGLWLCGFACATGLSSLVMFYARYRSRYKWFTRDDWYESWSWRNDWCIGIFMGLLLFTYWAIEVCGIKVSKRVKKFFCDEPWCPSLKWWNLPWHRLKLPRFRK